MQMPGAGQGLGPRPPYHPGMQQNGWQHQSHGDFQHTFYAGPHAFPQQYALVPLNGGAGMMNGPQQHPMLPAGPPPGMILPPGPGMGPSQMMRSPGMEAFNGATGMGSPTFGAAPAGGRGRGPRPPPGQPSFDMGGSMGRGRRGEGRGGARGRGRGRGTPPGRGSGPAGGRGAWAARGFGQQPPLTPPAPGTTKEQRKNAKAMAKLDKVVEAEGPRVYKALTEEERLEAARWQAERRKHYPTAANLVQKEEAAAGRQARGELEPEQALRRKRLQEVLMRQRELGLAQIAGTSDMPIDGLPPLASPTFGRGGRGGRGDRFGGRAAGRAGKSSGRGFGRGSGGAVSSSPAGMRPDSKRGMPFGEGQPADKRQKTANGEGAADGQTGGLASLMQYGSDDEGHEGSEGRHDAAGHSQSAAAQTPEEKQALYLKQRAQYERQQQQHQASMEKRKKAQEKWESSGRGRGRGRGRDAAGRGGGRGAQHSDRSPAVQMAKRAPTLLQKLLVKDIRRDHSHILQCFRFFVNNNFLQDVGSKPLVYPDPPPTLREVLPPLQDGDDSMESDGNSDEEAADGITAPPAVNGTASKVDAEQESDSSSEEDEGEEGDEHEEKEGADADDMEQPEP